jgi:hypothetical protein
MRKITGCPIITTAQGSGVRCSAAPVRNGFSARIVAMPATSRFLHCDRSSHP